MWADKMVGHRGHPHRFPENSLSGQEDALKRGARFVECDVQLNSEHQVYVCHDDELYRTAGISLKITEATSAQLAEIKVGEPARFSQLYEFEALPSLTQFIELLLAYPEARAMVEVKNESVETFGAQTCMAAILPLLEVAREQVIIIADDAGSLVLAREAGYPIGWIIHAYRDDIRREVGALRPDYLICNYKYLPEISREALWPGPWQWVFYHTDDPELARRLFEAGAALVETNNIGDMLEALTE